MSMLLNLEIFCDCIQEGLAPIVLTVLRDVLVFASGAMVNKVLFLF